MRTDERIDITPDRPWDPSVRKPWADNAGAMLRIVVPYADGQLEIVIPPTLFAPIRSVIDHIENGWMRCEHCDTPVSAVGTTCPYCGEYAGGVEPGGAR